MRHLALIPLLALAACSSSDEEAEIPVAEQEEAPVTQIIDGEDVTAIDAATDRDAGLADETVPGRDAESE